MESTDALKELQNLVSEYNKQFYDEGDNCSCGGMIIISQESETGWNFPKCQDCNKHYEDLIKDESKFYEIKQKAKAIYERALNWEGCGLCAKERKANQDEIKLLELCPTCQNLINQIKQLYEEIQK